MVPASVSPEPQQTLTAWMFSLACCAIVVHLGDVSVLQASLLEAADELLQRHRAVPVHVQAVEDPVGLSGRDVELLTDSKELILLNPS